MPLLSRAPHFVGSSQDSNEHTVKLFTVYPPLHPTLNISVVICKDLLTFRIGDSICYLLKRIQEQVSSERCLSGNYKRRICATSRMIVFLRHEIARWQKFLKWQKNPEIFGNCLKTARKLKNLRNFTEEIS